MSILISRLVAPICLILLVGASLSCRPLARVPEADPEPSPSAEGTGDAAIPEIEQFMRILATSRPSRGVDGSLFYLTFSTGVDQLYRLRPGSAEPEQLTSFEDGVSFYVLSPDGTKVAVGTSIGGSEQHDIHLVDLAGGTARPLLQNPEVVYENPVWLADSSAFYYRSNEANRTDFYLYRFDLTSNTSELFAQAPGYNWMSPVISNDRLLYTCYHSNQNSDVYSASFSDRSIAHLTPHEGDVAYFEPQFDFQGDIWVMTNRDIPLMGIARLLADEPGAVEYLVQDEWEVEEMLLSEDGRHLAYVSNENGYGRLHLIDLTTRQAVSLPVMPDGIARLGTFPAGHLMFNLSSATMTSEVWHLDLAAGTAEQVTHSDYAGVDRSLFREPTLVHYPSFDGRQIPAFLYLPPGYSGGIVPTIIQCHGGPESQFRPEFNRHFQYLMLNGFALFAPNIRGSSGYGKEYMALDNTTLRLDSVRDVGAAADWLIAQGYTDPAHLGIKGESYGGYMVLATITQFPDLFAAALEEVGIVNFVSFLQNTADYRRALREAEYGSLSDEAFLRSISPLYLIDQIRTPLLVVHGENDPRVPVGEARQVIEALESRGRTVEQLIFPDEGHGIAKLENRLVMYRRMVDFFTHYLVGSPSER